MNNRIKIKILTKNIIGMILSVIIIFSACLLIIFVTLQVFSKGKPEPYLDEKGPPLEGSLSEKVFVTIGGVKQGMFIKSKNINNPVLLYLHGGIPDYFLTRKHPTGLEDYFTMVWWEQRGSGISFSPDIPQESMTLDQMIKDAVVVTDYLRHRFGQEKIFLMGHSGGTFIGIHAAARNPELYHAYIGVAQISDQLKSEKLAYEYMLEQYRKNTNKRMVKKLESAPVINDTPEAYLRIRDKAMHELGVGTTHNMNSIVTGIFFPSLLCHDYTLKEKIMTWRGKIKSGVSSLWTEIINTDMNQKITKIDIPVYFFSGVYDYTVSFILAKEYYNNLQAPLKGFYTFEKSAHSPLFEEPEKMKKIIKEEVLRTGNKLAD